MSAEAVNLNDWLCQVGDPMPEDWRLQVTVYNHGAGIELIDPDGEVVEFTDDDLTADQMVQVRVNHARMKDGLEPHFDLPPYCQGLAVNDDEPTNLEHLL